jgi:hypothetical protein
MDVRIDQSGHDVAAAQIDRPHSGGRRHGIDAFDLTAAKYDSRSALNCARANVDDGCVEKRNRFNRSGTALRRE